MTPRYWLLIGCLILNTLSGPSLIHAHSPNAATALRYAHQFLEHTPTEENTRRGLFWAETAGNLGDPEGYTLMGETFFDARRPWVFQPTLGRQWLLNAAALKQPRAAYLLGMIADEGREGTPNPHEAEDWYRQAATAGLADAQVALGRLYLTHRLGHPDRPEAERWLLAAAQQDNPEAQYHLALSYAMDPTQVHTEEVLGWLDHAATLDHAGAQYDLGLRLLESPQTDPQPRGLTLIETAARHHHPYAQYMMGVLYETGAGVTPNIEEARRWYHRAADSGLTLARARLHVLRDAVPDPLP